jgi:hypothetical protein
VETEGINNPSKDSQQSLYSQSFLPNPDRFYGWGFLFFEVFIRKNTMYIKKLTPEEALESIKLRMKYDSSKTLNENKLLVLEQQANLTANQKSAMALGFGPVTALAADDLAKQGKLKTNTLKSIFSGGTKTPTTVDSTKTNNLQNPIISMGKAFQKEVEKATQAVKDSKKDNKSSKTTTTAKKPVVISIPSELKDIEGVKKFQDWLDKNHSGWHDKYKVLNSSVPKGYGKFGPRTNKWWKLQRVNYLNSSPTTNTTTPPKVDTTQSQPSTKIDTTPPKTQIPSASKGFQKFAQSQFGANSQPSSAETTTKPSTRVANADTEF